MKVDTSITVRYGETDMMGVVYHANYLLYFEDARINFLRVIGIPYEEIEEAGFMSPVVSLSINYVQPLRYGDVAIVRTYIISSRPTKTTYAYEVFKKGQDLEVDTPCCTGQTMHCLVDKETFKPMSVKRDMPRLYERYAEVLEPENGR